MTNAEQIYNLLITGHKIQAIKLLRENHQLGLGLKEAKDVVDIAERQHRDEAIHTIAEATGESVAVFINRAVEIVAKGKSAFRAKLTDRTLEMKDEFGNAILVPAELLDNVIDALKTFKPSVASGAWA